MCVHWGWRGDAALPSTPCRRPDSALAPGDGPARRRPPASRRRARTRCRRSRARSRQRGHRRYRRCQAGGRGADGASRQQASGARRCACSSGRQVSLPAGLQRPSRTVGRRCHPKDRSASGLTTVVDRAPPDAGDRPALVLLPASRPATAASTAAPNRRGDAPCLRPGVEGAEPLASPLCTQGVCWLLRPNGIRSQCSSAPISRPDSSP